MSGGGDKAAEDDGVGTLLDQRLEQLDQSIELRIGRFGEAFGLRDKGGKRAIVPEAGGRLDIDRITLVVVLVEHLLGQPLRIGSEPVAQRACCGSGR